MSFESTTLINRSAGNGNSHEPVDFVACQVCDASINVEGKKDQHVVKCDQCNEATGIKDAPVGQKYIRCQCNCLLMCKLSAQRVSCPRQSCRKIIALCKPAPESRSALPSGCGVCSDVSPIPGMCFVNCGHCSEIFMFNSLVNQLARCPHCARDSSVGRFAKTRGTLLLVLAMFALLAAVALTIATTVRVMTNRERWIFLFAGLYLASLITTMRSVYYLTMKNSIIIDYQL